MSSKWTGKTNAQKLRSVLLSEAEDVIRHYFCVARGVPGPLEHSYGTKSEKKIEEIWKAVIPIIQQADDPVTLTGISCGDTSERVDALLERVGKGEITPQEGKKLIDLIVAGYEVSELRSIMNKLDELEDGSP